MCFLFWSIYIGLVFMLQCPVQLFDCKQTGETG
jgi:hypothetical protein